MGNRFAESCMSLLLPPVCPVCRNTLFNPGEQICCQPCRDELEISQHPRCGCCGGDLDNALTLCSECLRTPGHPWVHGVSAFPYRGQVRELVHRFKYGGDTALTPVLGHAMATAWEQFGAGMPDLIVPVPLHWRREFSRGYSQTTLLGEWISRELEIPVAAILRRIRATPPQARLDLSARQTNVKRSFERIPNSDKADGKHCLLIDDVLTTGATLNAASAVLVKAGAAVSVLTIARG